MRHRIPLSPALTVALLVAGCASPSAESVEPTTSIAVELVSNSAGPATTAPVAKEFYKLLSDEVVYHDDEDGEWVMDVFYPDGEGPWPLVIIYHGLTTVPSVSEARTIAERGAVAVAPTWIKVLPPEMTRGEYIDGMLFDRAACAVGVAQKLAVEYGANPEQTTISGFSAGVHPAGWVGLGVVRNELCETPLTYQPVGLVLGDDQLLFYEDAWDELVADPDGSQGADTVDRFANPERWDVPEDLSVYLWTSDYRHGRDIENPPDPGSWILSRDTTGTLLDDLASLGAFDDEFVDFMDNGLLMEMRMKVAGIEVVHEAVGGGHYYGPTVFDAIESLITH